MAGEALTYNSSELVHGALLAAARSDMRRSLVSFATTLNSRDGCPCDC